MNDEKTIADLFDHKPFMVPKYQRGYRWQKVNVIDFLEMTDNLIHCNH